MSSVGFLFGHGARALADSLVTSPLFAWTWSGAGDETFSQRLSEFRPADSQTVIEMMDGKYLLGGTLIDTKGVSPFSVPDMPPAFFEELHGFGWLRHFQDLRDGGQRRFARTLLFDWIGRHGTFDRTAWAPALMARRILNWLKNFALLVDGATPDQRRTINRVLSRQVQALKLREPLMADPGERLVALIALAAATLSSDQNQTETEPRIETLDAELARQIDDEGLHKSRNPHTQLRVLAELIALRPALSGPFADLAHLLSARIETMRKALERLVLPTNEPGYFNGCGQLPVETVLAVIGPTARSETSSLASGYGVLVDGRGMVIADSGLVPPIAHAGNAHAGALSFEFACGNTLVVGNCGPAPAQLPESGVLFRHGSAHSAPTIDEVSNAQLGGPGALHTRLRTRGGAPEMTLNAADSTLELATPAYLGRYGLSLRRSLSLMGGGHTLVGQDRVEAVGRQNRSGDLVVRFHLGPGATATRAEGEDLIHIAFRAGEMWTFLWEGARADLEESVRHSLHFGLVHIDQIVLSAPARPGAEIAWVFTRQEG